MKTFILLSIALGLFVGSPVLLAAPANDICTQAKQKENKSPAAKSCGYKFECDQTNPNECRLDKSPQGGWFTITNGKLSAECLVSGASNTRSQEVDCQKVLKEKDPLINCNGELQFGSC
ncbi:hypothetical protein [Coxiella burnetii]|uniref:hypothetical protein n=1 Tax=Coxiella burnetii TaxID=777 RepID=UPI002230B3A1|nr:hypothetical protein [Coxiella burnetii]